MSDDVTIRFVTRQDYAQWLPLWDGYNAFYGRSGPTALAPEITAVTWQRFFDAYEPVHALVAEQSGKASVAVESRPTQPIDRTIARDKGRGDAIADQCIIFDRTRIIRSLFGHGKTGNS